MGAFVEAPGDVFPSLNPPCKNAGINSRHFDRADVGSWLGISDSGECVGDGIVTDLGFGDGRCEPTEADRFKSLCNGTGAVILADSGGACGIGGLGLGGFVVDLAMWREKGDRLASPSGSLCRMT